MLTAVFKNQKYYKNNFHKEKIQKKREKTKKDLEIFNSKIH
jgi:hypothetical protein